MPQLQQWAERSAAAPLKVPPRAAAGAVLLHPPSLVSVLFDTADGVVYQVLPSHFAAAAQMGVCVFTLRRIAVVNAHALQLHLTAASRCRLPLCVMEGGVTWRDVLITLSLVEPVLRGALHGWNVQVLGLDAETGAWLPITPALSSPLEARCFLHTNVEVLFEHYDTAELHVQATHLVAGGGGMDWHTPPDRNSAARFASPAAPMKNYLRAPSQGSGDGDGDFATSARRIQVDHFSDGEATFPGPPRCLAHDFDEMRTPSPPQLDSTNIPAPAKALWSRTAFIQQQQRWKLRCDELRGRVKSLSTDGALGVVREYLHCQRPPYPLPCRNDAVTEKGTATWTLSLLEYECQLTSDKLHEMCDPQKQTPDGGDELLPACLSRLEWMRWRAIKVCHVTDTVWNAEARAEAEGTVPADFPKGWLCLLLVSLRLRCLRHVAFVSACTRTANRVKQQREQSDDPRADDGHNHELDSEFLRTKSSLLSESLQTVMRLVEVLDEVDEGPDDDRLPRVALMNTLLTIALSLAEIAAYLSMDTTSRGFLLRAAILVCRVRLQCLSPRGDVTWLPRCITDVIARMQERLNGISLCSRAFGEYAEVIELLQDETTRAAQLNERATAAAVTEDGAAPQTDEKGQDIVTALGYTVKPVDSTAVVDAAFVQSNMVVQGIRRFVAAAAAHGKLSSESPKL